MQMLARLACAFALLASCGIATAATRSWALFAEPIFRNVTTEQGLPNSVVNAITEDSAGFLWLGTQGGLARWNGYSFRIYRPAAGMPGSLPDAWITVLHTDPRGNLWIGTTAGGLARYDQSSDSFIRYGVGPHLLSGVAISAIADDGVGGLWIGTENGLDHLDPETDRVETLRHIAGRHDSLPDDHVEALLHDQSGSLWIGTRTGLALRRQGSDRLEVVPISVASGEQPMISSLFQGPDRRIWIGTSKNGAFISSQTGSQISPVVALGADGKVLAHDWVYAIGIGDSGEIWLGTYGHGIEAIELATGNARRIGHHADLPRSLPSDTILALYKDRAGGIWVTSVAGVSRLASINSAIVTIFGGDTNAHILSDTDVGAVLAAKNGRIWLGLISNGIDILDPVLGHVATVSANFDTNGTGLLNPRILALFEGAGGDVFIGTYHGMYRADASARHIRRVHIPGRDPAARTIAFATTGGKLWVAGNNDGLWAINPEKPATDIEHLDPARLTDGRITCLARGGNGELWIGTRHGLNRLDLTTRTIEHILPDPANRQSLGAGYISSLILDESGRLWVGTFGAGVNVLTGRDNKGPVFRHLDVKQGLPDANVDAMLPDKEGRIWVTTDNGIGVIEARNFAVEALQLADGVAMSTYWARSAAATSQGELLFGGTGGGLTVVRPDRFGAWNYSPPIVIDSVRTGATTGSASRLNMTGTREQLTVKPDANSLAVEFSALDYAAPEHIRYAYRLAGFDHDWIETDASQRVASYTNLRPGLYTLQMRGTNRNGVWSNITQSLAIRVLPAWYQTWWFDIAMALLGILAVLALVDIRTRYLRRRQRDLEILVVERTAELVERKCEIEHIANSDSLTGLPNRRMFTQQFGRRLLAQASHGQHFALVLIDFDGFKQVNDTLGHDAGDALLLQAGERLTSLLRHADFVCRLGGDEFAILIGDLPGTFLSDQDAVAAMCLRVSELFVDPITLKGIAIKNTVSIGVALCPKHGTTQETLYKAADIALYEAKRCGKNTWRWFDSCVVPMTASDSGAPT